MTIRFTENNVGTGAYDLVKLDENGKLPAVDGSLLTNVTSAATNGKIFQYVTQDTATFTAEVDKSYWLRLADIPITATNPAFEVSQNYAITLPSVGVYTGSKVQFESFPRGAQSLTNLATTASNATSWTTVSGTFTITVPSHVGSGFSSIKANIFGTEYTSGQTWSSTGYSFRSATFYAYIDTSDNSLTWFTVRGGITRLGDMYRFDINETNPYVSGRSYGLIGDVSTSIMKNTELWQHVQITGTSTLAVGSSAGQLNPVYRNILITVNASTSPTITLPAASAIPNSTLHFKVLPNFKNTTLSDTTGRTKTGGFTLQRAGTDTLQWQPGVSTQTAYNSFVKGPNNYTAATGVWTNSVVVLYSTSSTAWAVHHISINNSYTN